MVSGFLLIVIVLCSFDLLLSRHLYFLCIVIVRGGSTDVLLLVAWVTPKKCGRERDAAT